MRNTCILFLILICTISIAQVSDFKNIDFTKANHIAELNKGEDLYNLPILSYKLTSKLATEVEKFKAIYFWVCSNIKGDKRQDNAVTRNRKKFINDSLGLILWNKKYKKKAYKKLLKYNKTMCTGYAYLIKELAFFADIDCMIIDGYGRTVGSNIDSLDTENHSWNAVKLDNKWYLCDATWSSGYMNENNVFITDYNDGYFLTEPILFAKNHYPSNEKWLLNSTSTKDSFVNSPLIYGNGFKHRIILETPSTMNVQTIRKEAMEFRFKILKDIPLDEIALVLFTGQAEKKLKIFDLKKENGYITFKNSFKWSGFYDVHLKIKKDIVATYTIKVSKSVKK